MQIILLLLFIIVALITVSALVGLIIVLFPAFALIYIAGIILNKI